MRKITTAAFFCVESQFAEIERGNGITEKMPFISCEKAIFCNVAIIDNIKAGLVTCIA